MFLIYFRIRRDKSFTFYFRFLKDGLFHKICHSKFAHVSIPNSFSNYAKNSDASRATIKSTEFDPCLALRSVKNYVFCRWNPTKWTIQNFYFVHCFILSFIEIDCLRKLVREERQVCMEIPISFDQTTPRGLEHVQMENIYRGESFVP